VGVLLLFAKLHTATPTNYNTNKQLSYYTRGQHGNSRVLTETYHCHKRIVLALFVAAKSC
jgi:hypothetical protein